ncbi:acyl-CoA thioesterase [bacterium]|nr:acyl-CoA thioesterase [bacterium]
MSAPASKPVSASRMELAEVMMPHQANLLGKVHGGVILAMIDKAAATCAIRHAGRTCVTASLDHVSFREPVEIGELVRLLASVNHIGRTSMEVGVKILSMNLATGNVRHTNSSYVTMVAVDEHGKPTPVPRLVLETDEDRRREREGAERARARKLLLSAPRG